MPIRFPIPALARGILAGALLACGLSVGAAAAPAPADSVISNRASATYFNTRLGVMETVKSNRVEVSVSAVPALEVTGGTVTTLTRGAEGVFVFEIRNTGNVALQAVPRATELEGDDFDIGGRLLHDAGGNGSLDASDPVLRPGAAIALAPGERVTLFLNFLAPVSVGAGDRALTQLRAEARDRDGTVVTGEAGAEARIVDTSLTMRKSASLRGDGGEIAYTIAVRNNAGADILPYAAIEGEAITLDGAPVTALVVRDTIPLNTHLVSVRPGGAFEAVYHRRGDAPHAYLSTPLTPSEEMDAVAFLHRAPYAAGRASDLALSVAPVETVDELEVANTALSWLDTPEGMAEQASNTVVTGLDGPGHSIRFQDGDTGEPIEFSPFNRNFQIRVGAATCNATQERDRVIVWVRTLYAGDEEQITAFETGANTGIFLTAPTAITRVNSATPGNKIIEGSPGDAAGATATAVCLGEPLSVGLQVQPGGFVFDSVTNAPIVGAEVFAFTADAVASAPALPGDSRRAKTGPRGASGAEAAAGGATGALVSRSITDGSGYYDLGAIPRGTYRIDVRPPATHAHPSVRQGFEGYGRTVDPTMSYGNLFSFDGGPISGLDIPVDPGSPTAIALDKTVNRREVRRGGLVLYTITARNNLAQAILNTRITDTPPQGFVYVAGSGRLDDEPLAAPPALSPDGMLGFDLGLMAPDARRTLTYAMRVGLRTRTGRRVNRAVLSGLQAGTGTPYSTPEARATVTVDDRGGVFSDEAVVIGRVYLDRNRDGIQTGTEEPGVPGVKIVTSTGLAAVTDAFGRYSLFGLHPATTVFALVRGTLPRDAAPLESDIDDLRDPYSRLVDLKRGELRGEDFALEWTPEGAAEAAWRLKMAEGLDRDRSQLRDDLPLGFDTPGGLSSRSETARSTTTEILGPGGSTPAPPLSFPEDVRRIPIGDAVAALDPRPGFVGMEDGYVAARRALTVRVKSPVDAGLVLSVNGRPVPESAIGAKALDRDAGIQLFEYVAVPLDRGANTLALSITDPFGNARGGQSITVHAPGDPADLRLVLPRVVPSGGKAHTPVTIRVVDADGRPVLAPVEVTLEAGRGRWDVRDIRDAKPGLQALVDNGEAIFDFIPPDLVGTETLTVRADFAETTARLDVVPDLNERLFVGVVEGAVGFGRKGRGAIELIADDEISPFEETTEGVRGQLYLKGKIRGDALLTLRYDSDRDTNDRLFRDIRRDEFYPVYGDNSERGFDAQSASRLYVKVEKDTSYMLYGDLAVEPESDAIRLGAYRRSVTGGAMHVERGPVTVDLFVARTDQEQRIVEIDGRGVSGPYDVSLEGIREGSEIVEIVVRDRDRPGVILSEQRQERLTDYTLDFFDGAIIFNRPVPRLDDNLNPVTIRVTYETERGTGDEYMLYGGELRVDLAEGLAIGYREVRSDADRRSDERRTVRSAYAQAELGGWGDVEVELSQTRDREGTEGFGARASYGWKSTTTTVRAEAARTDRDFDAPGSSVAAGREEARIVVERRVGPRLSLGAEGLYSRGIATGERRFGAELRARMQVTQSFDLMAGGRAVAGDRAGEDREETYSLLMGAAWRPGFLPGASLRAEYEQDIFEFDRRRALLGADYQIHPRLRFHALTEITSAGRGAFGLGDGTETLFTTKAGVEFRLNDDVTGYSEYRETAGSRLSGGVASGMRGTWRITERVSFRAGAEHVEPTADSDTRETSASVGIVYDDREAGLMLRADLEGDRDARGTGWYANTSIAYALDDDLTVLARNRLAVDDRDAGRIRDRLRLGAAWRPARDSRWKALALYEYELDDDGTEREQAHRWTAATVYAPRTDLRLSLKYAGERYALDGGGFEDDGTLHMLRGGAEVDLVENRVALAGNAMLFTDDRGESVVAGVGGEVKVSVAKNVQVGVGYNHIEIEEERLRDLYRSGWFMRLRLKLGDDVWAFLDGMGVTGE